MAIEDGNKRTWNGAETNAVASQDCVEDALMQLLNHFPMQRKRDPDSGDLVHTLHIASPRIVDTIVMGFYLRDCRGGKGARALGRAFLVWLARRQPQTLLTKVMHLVPKYGRWDDLLFLWNTCKMWRKEVIAIFAQQLQQDLKLKQENKPISLAAKWLPSERANPAFFRHLATAVSLHGPADLRKKVVAPLRKHLRLVEQHITNGTFGDINYSHVPSCAMQKYKSLFREKDGERFKKYLEDVLAGKQKMCASQLYPFQIVYNLLNTNDEAEEMAIEAQWRSLSASLGDVIPPSAVAIVDVSGSMGMPGHTPLDPINSALAMGKLVAEHSRGRFQNKFITFSENPLLCTIEGDTLKEQLECVSRAQWGANTNFKAAMELLMEIPSELPSVVYVFSDMQFDQAGAGTNWQEIRNSFEARGLEMPKVVFWNLSSEISDFALEIDDSGAIMLSGNGHQQFDLVRKCLAGSITPRDMLNVVLEAERYAPIRAALEQPPPALELPVHLEPYLSGPPHEADKEPENSPSMCSLQ